MKESCPRFAPSHADEHPVKCAVGISNVKFCQQLKILMHFTASLTDVYNTEHSTGLIQQLMLPCFGDDNFPRRLFKTPTFGFGSPDTSADRNASFRTKPTLLAMPFRNIQTQRISVWHHPQPATYRERQSTLSRCQRRPRTSPVPHRRMVGLATFGPCRMAINGRRGQRTFQKHE